VHVLIVKLGSIGDIVHTLPALAAIRSARPDAEISWAVEKRSAEILRGNPLIDNLIEVDTHSIRRRFSVDEVMAILKEQVGGLRKFRFDLAIDLQGLVKSAAIAKVSGAKQRWGFSRRSLREPLSRVLLTDTVDIPVGTHVIQKNLALAAAALGIEIDPGFLEFPIFAAPEHIAEADAIVAGLPSERFAVLNPGGGWATKLWPADRFGQLADLLWHEAAMPSLLTYGPGEEHLAEAAVAAARSGHLTAARPTLKGFYQLARRSSLYVGGDTGPTHIAVAAGAPVVGLFGPTEWWRNGSPRVADICVERSDIGCRNDCHRRACSNWICMDIDAKIVFAACVERLARSGRPAFSGTAVTLA
jgi:heptosyltransferase-1